MPKKTSSARAGAQRHKPRTQKSVELVRQGQTSAPRESAVEKRVEPAPEPVSVSATTTATAEMPGTLSESTSQVTSTNTAPKGSASARLAARRQAAQKTQQRSAASLISAEHYSYVRKDLIFIAILAFIMFSVIIILHFVPAIGG